MNVSEDNYQYELTRPADITFGYSNGAETQINQALYFKWLRAAHDFDPLIFQKELERYGEVTPLDTYESTPGLAAFLGVCEHCGK